MWIGVLEELKPRVNKPVLCYCPDWRDTQYQVAKWNGTRFWYEDDPNGTFNEHVLGWSLFAEIHQ